MFEGNPFPGLRPFQFDENYLFFGREEQVSQLLQRLGNTRFLAVVGASGSGKSSLVRAGLLPELHGGTMTDAGSSWEIAVMRPGGDPLTNLAKSLEDSGIYDTDEEQVEPLEDYLFEQGLEVMVPEFEGGEEHITKVHRDKLARCDAALIYFGNGTRAWVETKLMDLMQAPGYGREKEWLAKSVYVGPPEDRRKKRFKTHFAELIQAESAFDQTLVEPFVNSLKTN